MSKYDYDDHIQYLGDPPVFMVYRPYGKKRPVLDFCGYCAKFDSDEAADTFIDMMLDDFWKVKEHE